MFGTQRKGVRVCELVLWQLYQLLRGLTLPTLLEHLSGLC